MNDLDDELIKICKIILVIAVIMIIIAGYSGYRQHQTLLKNRVNCSVNVITPDGKVFETHKFENITPEIIYNRESSYLRDGCNWNTLVEVPQGWLIKLEKETK